VKNYEFRIKISNSEFLTHDSQLEFMPINYYIFLSIALFAIGIVGVLTRRNAIIIFMCIELMLNAVNLLLVAFSKMHHLKTIDDAAKNKIPLTEAMLTTGTDGQIFVFFIMVVAAAEVSVGLAIIVMMYRNIHSVDVNFLNRLKH
jgi:NADH-quinone oxidoreductase subunit K